MLERSIYVRKQTKYLPLKLDNPLCKTSLKLGNVGMVKSKLHAEIKEPNEFHKMNVVNTLLEAVVENCRREHGGKHDP